MAPDKSIQVDEGDFTRLHNTILEKLALARFTASEYRCLMFLFRKTYGWQKKEDAISLKQWAEGTGIDPEKRHNVLRTLQGLIAKNVIYAKEHDSNYPTTWGFNKHWRQWDASLFEQGVISPDNTLDPQGVISPDNRGVITGDNTSVISPDNRGVITGDNNKRKIKETIKETIKEKPRARARARSGPVHPNTQPIMDAYIEALGYKPGNYGQESAAAKQLAKDGYEPADIVAAYDLLKQDAFWKIKHLSLRTLVKEIPAMKQALLNGVPLTRAPTTKSGYMSKGERQEAEIERGLRMVEERRRHSE